MIDNKRYGTKLIFKLKLKIFRFIKDIKYFDINT